MSLSNSFVILSVVVIAVLLMTGAAWLVSGVPVADAAPKKPVPTVAPTPIIIIIYCDPTGCKRLPASAALVSQLHNLPGVKVSPQSIPALLNAPSLTSKPPISSTLNSQ